MDQVHILAPASRLRSTDILKRHMWDVDPREASREMNVLVTSIERTVFDCCRTLPLAFGLVVADSALHWDLTSQEALERYLVERGRGQCGIRRAEQAVALADGGSENGGESLARASVLELGFMRPMTQVPVFDPMEPHNDKYADLGWRLITGKTILGELDGLNKYRLNRDGTPRTMNQAIRKFAQERRRESHINLTGATVLRFSLEEALDPDYFSRLLTSAGVPKAA